METRTDRAESRKTVDLVNQFIDAAFKYRFLYVQNCTDGAHRVDAVQRAVLDSIQKAHTKAQTLLRSIEACGLPASESHDAWRLLSIGLPDASYADCERALKNWAKPVAAAGPVEPPGPVKRKPRGRYAKVELTEKQTEAVEQLGIHKTKTRAAINMGISRATFEKHHQAAMRKLGKRAVNRPKTGQYPTDQRGQHTISSDRRIEADDADSMD